MILVLKYVQNFIKIYKNLAGALTCACTLCMQNVVTRVSIPLTESQ